MSSEARLYLLALQMEHDKALASLPARPAVGFTGWSLVDYACWARPWGFTWVQHGSTLSCGRVDELGNMHMFVLCSGHTLLAPRACFRAWIIVGLRPSHILGSYIYKVDLQGYKVVNMDATTLHRTVIVTTVVFSATAILAILLSWNCPRPSPWDCFSVERVAAIVATLSLTISPGLYFMRRLHSDMTERQMASRSVYMELRDTLHGLDPNKHPHLRVVSILNRPVYFMSRLLNHDIYDSLVNSGKITFIDIELQQSIQDVFQHVKDHNMALRKVREMQESGVEPFHAYHLYRKLEESERSLLHNIPLIMAKLKEKYSIPIALS